MYPRKDRIDGPHSWAYSAAVWSPLAEIPGITKVSLEYVGSLNLHLGDKGSSTCLFYVRILSA